MAEAKVAFVAPGQGITSWQDGLSLRQESPRVDRIYERVYDATEVNIVDVCEASQPIEDPSVVQTAALGIGVARAEVLRHDKQVHPDFLIGLSAGEFTVSAISGALSLEDAAVLTHQRGVLQTEAAGGKGGVITALHRRRLDLAAILHGLGDKAYAANFHAKGVTGFGFLHEVRDELKDRLVTAGAKVVDVPVSFPPHGLHVMPAQEKLSSLFKSRHNGDGIVVHMADIPIIATSTARVMRHGRTIRKNLIWQTTRPTKLMEGINRAQKYGVEDYYDLGPGNFMTKLLGKILAERDVRIIPPTQEA